MHSTAISTAYRFIFCQFELLKLSYRIENVGKWERVGGRERESKRDEVGVKIVRMHVELLIIWKLFILMQTTVDICEIWYC